MAMAHHKKPHKQVFQYLGLLISHRPRRGGMENFKATEEPKKNPLQIFDLKRNMSKKHRVTKNESCPYLRVLCTGEVFK